MDTSPTASKHADSADGLTTPIDESSLAYKIFQAFVEDNEISATEEELLEYAVKDLNVNLSVLPSDVVECLPIILVAFINMWSGWLYKNEYKAGKFRKEHYFNRFRKFMTQKMRTRLTIKEVKDACSELANYKGKSAMNSIGRLTEYEQAYSDFSPYAISIGCPANMLNTIAFSNCGDDIIMRQHLGSTWHDLSTTQLINWPHVEVSFKTPDIYFVRKQATDFMRYLNFLPHEWLNNYEMVVEHAESLHSYDKQKECYSLQLLTAYIKEYVEALNTIEAINKKKIEEIRVILKQFLEDVELINVNKSMATNVSVLFRLSPTPFIRNKKLVKNTDKDLDELRVGYCEVIIPKIELVMMYFKAKQKNSTKICFEFTDKILHKAQGKLSESDWNIVMPHIGYKCTFCKVEYNADNSKRLIMDHLKNQHRIEQHVRCTVCRKQFSVANLAICRWRHRCIPVTARQTVTTKSFVNKGMLQS